MIGAVEEMPYTLNVTVTFAFPSCRETNTTFGPVPPIAS